MRKGGILCSLLGRPGKPLSGFSLERQKRAYGACWGLLGRAGPRWQQRRRREMLAPGPLSPGGASGRGGRAAARRRRPHAQTQRRTAQGERPSLGAGRRAECVHPDNVGTTEIRNRMFDLVQNNKQRLIYIPAPPNRASEPRAACLRPPWLRRTNVSCKAQICRGRHQAGRCRRGVRDPAMPSWCMGLASGAESPALGRGCRTSHGRRRSLSCRIKPYGSAPLSTACGIMNRAGRTNDDRCHGAFPPSGYRPETHPRMTCSRYSAGRGGHDDS